MNDVLQRAISGDFSNKDPYPPMKDKDARKAWKNKEEDLIEECHQALALQEGLTGHPREIVLWNLAWESGHAHGIAAVVNAYTEMAVLLKP